MAQKLNDYMAKRATCPDGKHQVIHWDSKLKGFGLRITAKGARSWIADYRCNGRQRRYTIGSIEIWGAGAARDRAREILRDAARGIDAMDQRNAARDAPTVRELWNKYDRGHLEQRAKRAQADVRAMWNKDVLPIIGNRQLQSITPEDIDKLHRKITDSGRLVRANRTIENMRRVFNLAIRWGWIEKNPTAGVKRNPEHNRERYLTPEEVRRLHGALSNCYDQTSAQAIMVLMLTGARMAEVLNMSWDQLDLRNGIWMKPPASTKQRRSHRVVLSGPVIALLQRRQTETVGDYVFPGRKGKPMTQVRKTWLAACRDAGLVEETGKPSVRLHDLRHCFASILAASGFGLKVIGDMLGHSQPQTTARYAHLYDDVARAAADSVGQVIETT
jgi:integrase